MEVSVWPGLWGRSLKSEAPRVKSFQAVHQFFNVTHCIAAQCVRFHVKAPILFLLRHLLKRFHAMFGLKSDKGAAVFSGNGIPEGAEPLAQAYAGH